MVKMKNKPPEVRKTYYLKPGQTLENTKISERSLAVIIPRSTYDRFNSYATENERVALLAEREAKRLAALKQATYDMSKTWSDTAQNIQSRRREELLSRKKIEEADRIKFTKEMAVKNAIKRAEIVKQAKEMLLYRKPQCRLINNALLVSECLRELDEQVKFDKTLKNIDVKLEEEYVKSILEDVKKFHEEEKEKQKARLNKIKIHKEESDKQILKNKNDSKRMAESIRKSEIEDLQNMSKEIDDIKQKELQQAQEKKEIINKMCLDDIEEKRQYKLKEQQEEELQEKSKKIYRHSKQEIEKIAKEKAQIAIQEKIRKTEMSAQKLALKVEANRRAAEEQKKREKEKEEQLKQELELEKLQKIKDKKEKVEKNRLAMKKMEIEQEKRKKEEMDIKLWEVLQRYKRDEFNKQWELQNLKEERRKRLNYGKMLKIQMAEKEAERKQAMMEDDDSEMMKKVLNDANEKIVNYGEKVLQESAGIRPLYPIAKVMGKFKREAGLIPCKRSEDDSEAPSVPKKESGTST